MGAAHRDTEIIIGNNITFTIDISETLLGDAEMTAPSDIRFTVKDRLSNETPVFQAKLGTEITLMDSTTFKYLVNVPANTTSTVTEGNYYYDLTLYFGDSVYTVLLGIIRFIKGVS